MIDLLAREPGNAEPDPALIGADWDVINADLWPEPRFNDGPADAYQVYCQGCGTALDAENGEAHLTADETGFTCDDCLYDWRQGSPRNEAAIRY